MKVKIYALDHLGRGIGKINNKVIFIPNTLVDEEVLVEITKETKKFYEGKVIQFILISPHRIKPKCPYYNECGGCSIMHMNYDQQLEFKINKVRNILLKYAKISIPISIEKSDKEFYYRNKITLHSSNGINGLYKEKTNDIIPIESCIICDEVINNYINKVGKKAETIIRTNSEQDCIITSQKEEFIKTINNIKYKLNINSFFQVNDDVCLKILNYVKENISINSKVLDLYCGVGTFAIYISDKVKEVLGVEVNDSSYQNSLENIELNNTKNVTFKHSKVENILDDISSYYDTIILDPPRSGIDDKTIDKILSSMIKKIIYISCEPITLARDLNKLKNEYKIKKIRLFDMFPQTYHCESVCVLERR